VVVNAAMNPKRDPDEDDDPVDGEDQEGRSDENQVDELGAEAGVTIEPNEPIRPIEKVAERDRHRWELDPASSSDYEERERDESEESRAPGEAGAPGNRREPKNRG
jgi:hypothetical protein